MKFIIFDIDGTLTDTKKVDDKCFIEAFYQTFKIDISNQKWEALKNVTDRGITEEIILRERNRKPRKEEYELMISNLTNLLRREEEKDISQFSEVAGAVQFFRKLKSTGEYKLGIATGAWEESAKIKLGSIGIRPNEVCFSNSNYYKSREEITQKVISQLRHQSNQKPERIIYFGDGEWDYKTCKKLGIAFIGIDITGNGKLKSMGAESVFENYLKVDAIMKEMRK